jgi:hypothetical protein
VNDITLARIRFILVSAVIGLAWACSLRAMMMALAGPDSNFTFSGTFGIILATGVVVGALLGWAEHQRRTGPQHRLLILTPLLIGLVPLIFTRSIDPAPIGLALLAMVGGYSVSGRGPLWSRILAGTIALADVAVPYFAPKPDPALRATTAYGAWFATLASSLYVTLALASSIPMRQPDTARNPGDERGSPPDDPVAPDPARTEVSSSSAGC